VASAARATGRDLDGEAPALIIGAGYAGAVAALRLAQAGIPSILLERGIRWPIRPDFNTFCTIPNLDRRASWMSTTLPVERYVGVLETTRANGITVTTGAGVGGGSLVNHGVTMQPPEEQFARSFGDTLGYREMARTWYPRAWRLLGASPIPDDVLADPHYGNAREFLREATAAGLGTRRADLIVDWSVVRDEIAGRVPASAIAGESEVGINSGAKLSVDRTILARAEATGLVSVRTLHQVTDLRPTRNGKWQVECELIDEAGNVVGRPRLVARHVFLAAGSMGTTKLLVRAKALGSLPDLPDAVGRFWGSNGDRAAIRLGMPGPPTTGGPGHIVAFDWTDRERAITLAEFPGGPSPVPGTGASGTFVMQVAPALGAFTYDGSADAVNLTWPNADPRLTRLDGVLTDVLDRLNAANPGTSTFFTSSLFTSHPLGGAVLGSACRPDGGLRGHRNLFVIDSSLIPGSTGAVTPSLTVTALADRCVSLAIREITH
jgi:cholesterol oxidase